MCTQESMETPGKVCLTARGVNVAELERTQQTGGQIQPPCSPDDKSKLIAMNPTSLKRVLENQVEWNELGWTLIMPII